MNWNPVLKYVLYSIIASSVLSFGCTSTKISKEVKLEGIAQEEQSKLVEEPGAEKVVDLEKIVKIAESHYEKGYAYYKERKWALAEQEFDRALRTLLDADVDAETHYKLGKAYDSLFYNIHKIELEESFLRGVLSQKPMSDEEVLSAAPSQPSPKVLTTEDTAKEKEQIPESADNSLGEIVINEADPEIQKYVKQFSPERSQFRTGMERGTKYLPMIQKIFQSYKLPTELIYLPLIESNFRLDAVSPTGAVGLWQFVQSTAKIYGLKVNKWVDERYDPEKSTVAAVKYLSDLYQMLGCWDLVLAGYYMGEYKVHKAIGLHRTRDISALAETKSFGHEAKRYITRFKAVALMAKNPEKYGLDLAAIPPLSYDTVQVRKGEQLKNIAERFGVSYKQLQELNPELRKSLTPPGKGTYTLKVPFGVGDIILAQATSQLEKNVTRAKTVSTSEDVIVYEVEQGDTLFKIATQYRVDAKVLSDLNNISNPKKLQIGQQIRIPISGGASSLGGLEIITHTVQKGESLASIARRYKVAIETLKAYNTIQDVRKLQIGRKLDIPLSGTSVLANNQTPGKKEVTYRVKRGDSLSKIASTFGVSVSQLKEWNKFEDETLIYPGSRIKVWY